MRPTGTKVTASVFTMADVVDDTGWKYSSTANPDYGLHDYERIISFSGPLSPAEEKAVEEFLQKYDNPGYVWWTFKHLGNNQYRMTTVYDSSD